MEIEDIILSVKGIDFDKVIKKESREYLTSGYKCMPYRDRNDDKKFITNGLRRFINKNDKIIFLLEAIGYLNEEICAMEEQVNYKLPQIEEIESSLLARELIQSNQEQNRWIVRNQAQIFYAVRELEKLGLNGLDKNAFSNSQVSELRRKLDAILIKIDELVVGQEIIYDFISELKTDLTELKSEFPLGKKRWYQRFSGIVTSYLGSKGADAIYDELKPYIIKIIQETVVDKYLH